MRTILVTFGLFLTLFAGEARAATLQLLDEELASPMPFASVAAPPAAARPEAWRRPTALTFFVVGALGAVGGGILAARGLNQMTSSDIDQGLRGVLMTLGGGVLLAGGAAFIVAAFVVLSPPNGSGGDAPALAARPVEPPRERATLPAPTELGWSGRF